MFATPSKKKSYYKTFRAQILNIMINHNYAYYCRFFSFLRKFDIEIHIALISSILLLINGSALI